MEPKPPWALTISAMTIYVQLTATRLISRFLLDISKGVVAFLVLLGVSSGLRMIVETNSNRKFRLEELEFADKEQNNNKVDLFSSSKSIDVSGEKGNSFKEFKVVLEDTDPVFYDPNKVTLIIKWIYRSLNFLVILYVVNSLSNIGSIKSLLGSGNYPLISILMEIVFSIILILITIIIRVIELRTLAYLLKILREMEINSR